MAFPKLAWHTRRGASNSFSPVVCGAPGKGSLFSSPPSTVSSYNVRSPYCGRDWRWASSRGQLRHARQRYPRSNRDSQLAAGANASRCTVHSSHDFTVFLIRDANDITCSFIAMIDCQMQANEDTIKQQQNEIEDLKRKLRLKDEAEAKVSDGWTLLEYYPLFLIHKLMCRMAISCDAWSASQLSVWDAWKKNLQIKKGFWMTNTQQNQRLTEVSLLEVLDIYLSPVLSCGISSFFLLFLLHTINVYGAVQMQRRASAIRSTDSCALSTSWTMSLAIMSGL